MGKGKVTRVMMECERLDILHTAYIGCRISDMTYGYITCKSVQMMLTEYLNHKSGTLMQMHALLVDTDDTATLLTAMLQAVQRIIGILGGVLHTIYAKHSAFVMNLSLHKVYSTVTDFARLRGWSTSRPLAMAI